MTGYVMDEIEKAVKVEDFEPGTILRELAQNHGVECVLLLTRIAGGTRYYVPSYDTITKQARKRLYKGKKSIVV